MSEGRWRGNRFGPFLQSFVRKGVVGAKATPVVLRPASDDFGIDPASLVEFVLKSRIDLLAERTYDPDKGWIVLDQKLWLKRGAIAAEVKWAGSRLTGFLDHASKGVSHPKVAAVGRRISGWAVQRQSERFKDKTDVSTLEAHLQMFAMRERGATLSDLHASGSMTTFWQEMLGSGETAVSLNAQQARWFRDLVETGPQNAAEALMAGEALLSLLSAACDEIDAQILVDQHREQVTRTVRGLLTVATRSPGRGAMPAIHLLSHLGCLKVQWDGDATLTLSDLVVEHVTSSPVGFRAIPILTRTVSISAGRQGALPAWWSKGGGGERRAVWSALERIQAAYDRDPYPARSFWVESLRALMDTDSPQSAAKALSLLEARARAEGRPVRERAYAGYCVFLALRKSDSARIEDLCSMLEQSTELGYPEGGLVYAGKLIRLLMTDTVPDSSLEGLLLTPGDPSESDLPEDERPAVDRLAIDLAVQIVDGYLYPHRSFHGGGHDPVADANAAILNRLPDTIREAFVGLTRYALLSIDGTGRRRAVEALREAGVANEAACLIVQVLEDDAAPVWVREHAAFLLGHLTDPVGVDALLKIAMHAHTVEDLAIRSAAIWALGDIAHPDEAVISTLVELTEQPANQERQPPIAVLRAATYSLATLHPEPDDDSRKATILRLEQLARHSHGLIADLAKWGLIERDRSRNRRDHRSTEELWGIARDLRATLDSMG